jgi:hypothetical protein
LFVFIYILILLSHFNLGCYKIHSWKKVYFNHNIYKKKDILWETTQKFSKDLEYGTHFEWESIKYIEDFFNKFLIKQNKSLKFLNENFSSSVKELKVGYEIYCSW